MPILIFKCFNLSIGFNWKNSKLKMLQNLPFPHRKFWDDISVALTWTKCCGRRNRSRMRKFSTKIFLSSQLCAEKYFPHFLLYFSLLFSSVFSFITNQEKTISKRRSFFSTLQSLNQASS